MHACPRCQTPYPDDVLVCALDGLPLPAPAADAADATQATPLPDTTEQTVLPQVPTQPDPMVGQVLGSYRIVALIGAGGMGKVYRAEHVKLARPVAIKMLRPEHAERRGAIARFFNEARAVNAIRHPNIVDVSDFIELPGGGAYIVMELLDGRDLASLLREQGALPRQRALAIAVQICDGLEAAHTAGILHRDLKPDNVFVLPDGRVKLLDFGVAKLLGDTRPDGFSTAAGALVGTPAYMSPEQAAANAAEARSDIYSLGAILYEMLTGHPVFTATSFGEFVVKHMRETPRPPSEVRGAPPIDAALEQVVLRCLAKRPEDRWPSAAALGDALSRLAGAPAPLLPARTRRLLSRVALAAAGLSLGMLGAVAAVSLARARQASRSRPGAPARIVAAAAPQAPAEDLVAVTLATTPPGAHVLRMGSGDLLGTTPVEWHARAGEEAELSFLLEGYRDERRHVVADAPHVETVALVPLAPERRAPARAPSAAHDAVDPAPAPAPGGVEPVPPEMTVDPFAKPHRRK